MADEPKSPDQHETRSGVLARPDPELRDATRGILEAHGWTMNDFLIACMVVLGQNPEGMLKRLTEARPPAKKPGPKPGRKTARRRGRSDDQ